MIKLQLFNKMKRHVAIALSAALILAGVPSNVVYATQTREALQIVEQEEPVSVSSNDTVSFNEASDAVSSNDTVSTNDVVTSHENENTENEDGIRYILGRPMTAEEEAAQKAAIPDNLPSMEIVELPESSNREPILVGSDMLALESTYDARELDIITTPRSQSPWGSCWTFSGMSIMETAMVKQGLASVDSIDLSEHHLAYFVGHTGYDPLGNASEDTIISSPVEYYMEKGGHNYSTAMKLMNWHGGASEESFPYPTSASALEAIDNTRAQEDVVHVKDFYLLDTTPADATTIAEVKTLVKEYGSVAWSFYINGTYLNSSTGGYYNYEVTDNINHAITIVGWDDTYSRNNFGTDEASRPVNDGAWIAKNSYGSWWGDNGYMYISYEDKALGYGNAAAAMTVDAEDTYDNNYFYGNTVGIDYYPIRQMAQIYQVKGLNADKERLDAISMMLATAGVDYSIQVYKNPEFVDGVVLDPTSGEAMLATPVTGSTTYAGIHTIPLTTPVTFDVDDYMAIVVSFSDSVLVYSDGSRDLSNGSNIWTEVNVTAPGQSFVSTGAGYWQDIHGQEQSIRLNALTVDIVEDAAAPELEIAVVAPKHFNDTMNYKLTWKRTRLAQSYVIYRAESAEGAYEKIATLENTVRTYNDSIAQENWDKTYYYKIKVCYTDATSLESEAVTAEADATIGFAIDSVTVDSGMAILNWSRMEGAVGYEIQRKEQSAASFVQAAVIYDGDLLSYTDNISVFPMGVYEYRMRAFSEAGEYTDWSEVKAAINTLTIKQIAYNQIQFDSPEVEGAACYWCRIVMGGWIFGVGARSLPYTLNIANYAEDYAQLANFQVGDPYKYYVEVQDGDGNTIFTSNTVTFATTPDPLVAECTYENGIVELTWTGGGGADYINIYRSNNQEEKGELLTTVTATDTSYQDAAVTAMGNYYYTISPEAINSKDEVIYGEAGTCMAKVALEAPSITSVTPKDETSIEIQWSEVEGAEVYKLYYSEDKGETYQLVHDWLTETSYTHYDRVPGKTYYYKVQISAGSMTSLLEDCEAVSAQTKPAAPVVVKQGYDYLTIKNNTSYEYAIGTTQTEAEGGVYVSNVEAELTFEGLTEQTTYYIAVRTREDITGEAPINGETLETKTDIKPYLVFSADKTTLKKGEKIAYTIKHQPQWATLEGEKSYSARLADESATECIVEVTEAAVIVKGSDNKEILRLENGKICATAESKDKKINLCVKQDIAELEQELTVSVPVEEITLALKSINGEAAENLDDFRVGDTVTYEMGYAPENADTFNFEYTLSNTRVLQITESSQSSITLSALSDGDCTLTVGMDNGDVKAVENITVKKQEEIYAIWVSDTLHNEVLIEKDEQGAYVAKNLETYPTFTLYADGKTAENPTSMQLYTYWFMENDYLEFTEGDTTYYGKLTAPYTEGRLSFRSTDTTVVRVNAEGVLQAVSKGEADIFVCDTLGSQVFGRCHIVVDRLSEEEEDAPQLTYPINKDYVLSAVEQNLWLEAYCFNTKSSCQLKIQNQYGELQAAELFDYKSSDTSICIVDGNGVVTPNPGFVPVEDATVIITATLRNDKAARKVTFNVTVGDEPQIGEIRINRMELIDGESKETWVSSAACQKFVKGETVTFGAVIYDNNGAPIDMTAVAWTVSDKSVASAKANKDGTVTLTWKKAGRIRLTCQTKDEAKKKESIQVAALITTPIVNKTQVNVNIIEESKNGFKVAESFKVWAPNGAQALPPQIKEIKAGKQVLTARELKNFAVITNEDGIYSFAIQEDYAKTVKKNTVYTVTFSTNISGIPELGITEAIPETFQLKCKVLAKEPSVKVTAAAINRFYVREEALKSLLSFTSANKVTHVRVLTAAEGQLNDFDSYFSAQNVDDAWYLSFTDENGNYTKNSIKGKIAITVAGYDEVVKTITVKTPMKGVSLKQQLIPGVFVEETVGGEAQAILELYNTTEKKLLTDYVVESEEDADLQIKEQIDGKLIVTLSENALVRDGATLSTTLKVMATEDGEYAWSEWADVKISVKIYTNGATVGGKATGVKLNKQTSKETVALQVSLNCQNTQIGTIDSSNLYAYDSDSKDYTLQGASATEWLSLSYEEGILTIGLNKEKVKNIPAGTYKFRLKNFVQISETVNESITKDITVTLLDKAPTIKVKTTGSLDLVKRESTMLKGTLKLSNITADVKEITILREDKKAPHEYFEAKLAESGEKKNTFTLQFTEQGCEAALQKGKVLLPVQILLENGTIIQSTISFKLTQSVPKVTVPAMQTIYKSIVGQTREYDLTTKLTAGTTIKKMEALKVPEGLDVTIEGGNVIVKLNDRSMKAGTYKFTVNIYFEGAQALDNYPDGKPVSKVVKVKIVE